MKSEVERKSNPIIFTGEIGSGKTVLLRTFLKSLGPGNDLFQILYRGNDRAQFLQMILLEMGVEPECDGVDELRSVLEGHLKGLLREDGETFLVIDEAQELGGDTLDEICLLSRLKEDGRHLVRIIMAGLPELRDRVCASSDFACSDAVTEPYHLRRLPDEEIPKYIHHRLAIAGCTDPGIFPDDVLREICRFSRGIPRLINMICDAALLYGHFSGKKVLTMALLKEVIADVFDNANTEESYQYETASVASVYVSADYAEDRDRDATSDVRAEKAHEDTDRTEDQPQQGVCKCQSGPIPMTVLLLERNARMRVRLEDRFHEKGVSTVVLSTLEELFKTLDSSNERGLQVLVADASFFFARGGTEDPEGKKALDRIQSDYAYLPLIVTATLPLTVIRTKLFQRGIPLLLYKPDLNRIDLSEVHTQFDSFFNELQRCLSNIHSQFEAICQKTIRWLTEPQASEKQAE
ncbi:MAG: AAA family ATPase [Nitrospirae bacterium]|nr:AAA family ATPase [Nitrospirota bacterium]